MPEPVPPKPAKVPLRPLIAIALVGVAVAITLSFWLSNAGTSSTAGCAPQLSAAAAIDSAAQGQLAAIEPTGKGRG